MVLPRAALSLLLLLSLVAPCMGGVSPRALPPSESPRSGEVARLQTAVVVVPVASVFAKPSAGAERVTQALLGERMVIRATRGGWAEVYVPAQYRLAQGYPGWMLRGELALDAGDATPDLVVRTARATLHPSPPGGRGAAQGDAGVSCFLGTRLESAGAARGGWQPVRLPGSGKTAWIRASDVVEKAATLHDGGDVIRTALLLRGTRYLWGGLSVRGIDCSGLTYEAFGVYGIALPRDADQQFQVGTPVDRAALQPGDLVFFGKSRGQITHVGIYKGEGLFVEAAGRSGVTVTPLSARQGYQGARRVIGVPLAMPPPSP
jgi:hypothetical protein